MWEMGGREGRVPCAGQSSSQAAVGVAGRLHDADFQDVPSAAEIQTLRALGAPGSKPAMRKQSRNG